MWCRRAAHLQIFQFCRAFESFVIHRRSAQIGNLRSWRNRFSMTRDHDGKVKKYWIEIWNQAILSRFSLVFCVRSEQNHFQRCKLVLQIRSCKWGIDDFHRFPGFYLALFDFTIVILAAENLDLKSFAKICSWRRQITSSLLPNYMYRGEIFQTALDPFRFPSPFDFLFFVFLLFQAFLFPCLGSLYWI